jgi:hypothetical protein
VVLDEQAQWD